MFAPYPFSNIYLVTDKLECFSERDIFLLEQELGFKLPEAYYQFAKTLGSGIYCDFVRVLSPEEILHRRRFFQEKYVSRWEKGTKLLSLEEILSGVILADTTLGDHIRYIPSKPDELYTFLHDNFYLDFHVIPSGFYNLGQWFDQEGNTTFLANFQYFSSWRNRKSRIIRSGNTSISLENITERVKREKGITIHHELAEEDEYGKYVTLFIPDIKGCVSSGIETIDEETQEIEVSCEIIFDADYELQAGGLIEQIGELGFNDTV